MTGPRALSRYKQVRLTFTEEARCVSYRVMVKPLEADWNMRQTIVHGTTDRPPGGIQSMEDALLMLITILEDQVLPPVTRT